MRFFPLLVLAPALLALVACQQQPPPEVYGHAPAFTLTDHTGAPFNSAALQGRAVLLDFVYTHCTDACPLQHGGHDTPPNPVGFR